MLIAFHTKHIMGAPSVKAGLLLRVGFIELGRRKAGPEKALARAGFEGSGGDSARQPGTPESGPVAARVGASASQGPRLTPRRGPGAEKMSAQVRTRLRFRHPRAAAGRAGGELEKVGPVRPLAPGALRSLQRRQRQRVRGAGY